MATKEQREETARKREQKVQTCCRCKLELPWGDFYVKTKQRPFGLDLRCKKCKSILNKSYTKDNFKLKISRKKTDVRRKFDLSVEEYDSIILASNNVCEICKEPTKRPVLDHCHQTNKIRGVLCPTCNVVLGLFKDSPKIFLNAANYLSSKKDSDE